MKTRKGLQSVNLQYERKMNSLNRHLGQFPSNLVDAGDEEGEIFQQDIKIMLERNQGRSDSNMMAHYS